jgi:glutamate/tyrosine decarboxylase-like PLP-dependent enzyme
MLEVRDGMTTGRPRTAEDPFAEVSEALDRADELARAFVAGLSSRPVSTRPGPAEMAELLDEPLPEHGCAAADAVSEWFRRAEPGIVASPGPRFFGFVNGGATPAALAGDWLASAIDQNAGLWLSSPAAAQTELTVMRWLRELFGLPPTFTGALTSGATMANLVGLAAARQWAGERLGFDAAADGLAGQPPIPVIASTELHASARKALGILGLGRNAVRTIPAPEGALDLEAFDAVLAGMSGPVIVVANAGEVNTGAFDPLAEIAERCARNAGDAWLHVDGAFGLFAAVSPRYAHLSRGVERADSLAADGHKWLNVPYDCGFAFVRDAGALRGAFNAGGAYLAPGPDTGWDPHTQVPEMSRRFRGLAAWCALKAYGRAGYRDLIERCAAHAAAFGAWVTATPGFELLAPVPLNIVCFRVVRPGLDDDGLDAANRALVTRLQADGRVFVTETTWQGRAAIRAAFDNWATSMRDVVILQEAAAELASTIV